MQAFAGGRDDPFVLDIAGFFRSISWRSALKSDGSFTWEGDTSYLASPAAKESSAHVKGLLQNRDPKRVKGMLGANGKEGVYSGYDWRLGNNINALSFSIPLKYINAEVERKPLLRIWAESFITDAEFNRISQR